MPGGYGPGSPQAQWLAADLAQNSAFSCTVAIGHHPRWASGSVNGDNPELQTFWCLMVDAGVDLYLAGHNHNMQRYLPLDAAGLPDPSGPRQIIIGTGGRDISGLTAAGLDPEVEAFANTFGVLRIALRAGSYDWSFISEPGDPKTDAGSAACVAAPTNAAPLAVTDAATTPADTAVVVPVLLNDLDVNGSGSPNLDPASVTVVTPPTGGQTLVDPASGQITYLPDPDFSGDDPFRLRSGRPRGRAQQHRDRDGHRGEHTASLLTFTPSDDTYVKQSSPTRNYGGRQRSAS